MAQYVHLITPVNQGHSILLRPPLVNTGNLQLPYNAIKWNEDMRQSGAVSPAMWAGAGPGFLLLCSQTCRFYGKDFYTEKQPALNYKSRELDFFFLCCCYYPDPHKVFQWPLTVFLQGSWRFWFIFVQTKRKTGKLGFSLSLRLTLQSSSGENHQKDVSSFHPISNMDVSRTHCPKQTGAWRSEIFQRRLTPSLILCTQGP